MGELRTAYKRQEDAREVAPTGTGVLVTVGVGEPVLVAPTVGAPVSVLVGVSVGVAVSVGVLDTWLVTVAVGVFVRVLVTVGVGESVGVFVMVGVSVAVGVLVDSRGGGVGGRAAGRRVRAVARESEILDLKQVRPAVLIRIPRFNCGQSPIIPAVQTKNLLPIAYWSPGSWCGRLYTNRASNPQSPGNDS